MRPAHLLPRRVTDRSPRHLLVGACLAGLLSALVAAPAVPPALPLHQDAGAGRALPVVEAPEGQRPTADVTVADLGWLEGLWVGSDGHSDWESVYTSARGGMIVGASKELQGGRVVMSDFEQFYERDGEVHMTPFPFGKRSVEFTLTDHRGDEKLAVFENPEHDFPKSFRFQRVGDDRLTIALAGDMGHGEVEFTLDLRRQGTTAER